MYQILCELTLVLLWSSCSLSAPLDSVCSKATRGGPPRKRIIQTLDSSRLSPSDYLDLSDSKSIVVYSGGIPSGAKSEFRFLIHRKSTVPFPADTRGFLYFQPHSHPSRRWFGSEIRFRITQDEDPSSFAAGKDLCLPNCTSWHLPIVPIATNLTYSGLRHLLLRDSFIGDSGLERCAALESQSNVTFKTSGRVIHSFGQLFSLNFHIALPKFVFLTANGMYRKCLPSGFLDQRNGSVTLPYTGRLMYTSKIIK